LHHYAEQVKSSFFEQRLFMELFHEPGTNLANQYSAYIGLIVGRIIGSVNGWQNVVGELGQKSDWPLPRIIWSISPSQDLDG
jgi:hypothetical protein